MRRLFEVCLLPLMVQCRPESTYRFTKALPNRAARIQKQPNPIDEFGILPSESSRLPQFDCVNIVMPGVSFDREQLPMLDGPTYLVNWTAKVPLDDVVYFTADIGWLQYFWENEMFPICFLDWYWPDFDGTMCAATEELGMEHVFDDPRVSRITGYHKAVGHKEGPIGSGLGCVAVLAHLAKRVEVYGWDCYLAFAPNDVPYWKAFWGMLNVPIHLLRRRTIQSGIYNWHYANRFSQLASFKNHGYLGQLDRHPGLLRKLERVFYNK